MGVKEFMAKVAADKAFKAKFADAKSAEDVVKLAAREGYSFTADEVRNAAELDDDELEAVAGGTAALTKKLFT